MKKMAKGTKMDQNIGAIRGNGMRAVQQLSTCAY
jgi:hypothetical protein